MRTLDLKTLNNAGAYYAARFIADSGKRNRDWVMRQLFNLTFKDEFTLVLDTIKQHLGPTPKSAFNDLVKERLKDRTDKTFQTLLAEKLAIDPDGNHISGLIGTTQVHGRRPVGKKIIEVETPESIKYRKRLKLAGVPAEKLPPRLTHWRETTDYWPIYAGETEERVAGDPHGVCDALPEGHPGLPVGALNTRISNECAILACDSVVDNLDEGTGAAVAQGRSGTQPTDPDTAVTGTLLFTVVYSDPAFGAASDAAPGATATASAVTPDTSADATGTVGYCRVSSTNDGATPLDDHIDGEAGTATADFVFDTTSIVAGAEVAFDSHTVTMPES